jgi:hypothetical protein
MKKSEGAISIFLAVIMLANFILSGVVLEGARLRQAEAIVQSAADSAAMSVLAKYDSQLYDRYGLFVMDSETQQNIQDDFINFFMANLSASLPSDDSLNSLFTKLEQQYNLKGTFDKVFDMYDFQANEIDVSPEYSIGSPQILQLQTTEVAKYRSAFLLLQDVTGMGDDLAEAANQQQKDVTLMQESLDYREKAQDISGKLANFTQELYVFYDGDNGSNGQNYNSGDRLRNEYNTKINEISSLYGTLSTNYSTVTTKFAELKKAVDDYNTGADSVRKAEKQLQQDKASIQFDSSADDYDADEVKKWKEQAAEVDKQVEALKTKLSSIETKSVEYNNAVSALTTSRDNLANKINETNTTMKTWSEQLNGFINEWTGSGGLLEQVKQAKSEAESYKASIEPSGASQDVQDSANADADASIQSLTEAENSEADKKLEKTKSYIDGISDKLGELESYVKNIKFTTPEFNGVTYKSDSGTIAKLQQDANDTNAKKTSDEEKVRPKWEQLSDINGFASSDTVKVDPSDVFSNGFNTKFNSVKKPNGKDPFPSEAYPTGVVEHYKYDSHVTYSVSDDGGSGSSKINQLKSLYEQNKGKNMGKDDDSAEANNSVSDDWYSKRPSANRDAFKISDAHIDDDNSYFAKFKKKYANATSPDANASIQYSSDEATLNSFSSIQIGEDKTSQNNALQGLNNFLSSVGSYFTGAQYDVMTYVYTMGMFKNRLSKSPGDYWKPKYESYDKTQSVKNGGIKEVYVERDSEDADLNLMLDHQFAYNDSNGNAKDGLQTVLDCELEYILRGNKDDKSNRNQVWAIIYGLRLGNNLVAVYSNEELRDASAAAADAIAAALSTVTFGLGAALAPLIQFAIIAIIAALETVWDMDYLVNKGFKVPFIKTKDNLNISLEKLTAGNPMAPSINKTNSKTLVKYEDYLLIFLLFTNQETVLFRTADLIQFNMSQQNGELYDLTTKKTYIRCKSQVSIKPMMISYAIMPDDLKSDDRRIFEALIYQGY